MSVDRRTGEPISDEEMDRRARSPARVTIVTAKCPSVTIHIDVKSISSDALYRECRRRKLFASKGIDFECDDDDWPPRGDIIVGGMRTVGRWEVIERAE